MEMMSEMNVCAVVTFDGPGCRELGLVCLERASEVLCSQAGFAGGLRDTESGGCEVTVMLARHDPRDDHEGAWGVIVREVLAAAKSTLVDRFDSSLVVSGGYSVRFSEEPAEASPELVSV
jgi:hypothetical protein